MKKLLIALLVLGLIFAGVSLTQADSTRTRTYKSTVVTSNTVVSASGATLYHVTGYANAANAFYALVDTNTTAGSPSSTLYKVESGEASQYDGLPTIDFGDEGLVFNTGLTVFTTGAYVTVIYE